MESEIEKNNFSDCPKSASWIVIIVNPIQGGIEMFTEEMLKQAAEKAAEAICESLPEPEQCQHQFSERFEQKMQAFFSCIFTAPNDDRTKKP